MPFVAKQLPWKLGEIPMGAGYRRNYPVEINGVRLNTVLFPVRATETGLVFVDDRHDQEFRFLFVSYAELLEGWEFCFAQAFSMYSDAMAVTWRPCCRWDTVYEDKTA